MPTNALGRIESIKAGSLAFDFLRVLRERPWSVALIIVWTVFLYFVGAVISQAILLVEDQSTATALRIITVPIAIFVALMIVIGMPVAWLRLLTKGEMLPGLPFRLGGDEWRFVVGAFCIHAIGMLATLPGMMVGFAIVMLLGTISEPVFNDIIPSFVIAPALVLAGYVYVFIRLGPSLVMSFTHKRLMVTRSWKATKAIRFKVLLAWLPVAILVIVASIVLMHLPQAEGCPVGQPHMVEPKLLAGVLLVTVFCLLVGWSMAIHTAIARYLIGIDPSLRPDDVTDDVPGIDVQKV